MKTTKTNGSRSLNSNNAQEATMVKLTITTASVLKVLFVEKLNSRVLYKALRDEKVLPAESVGKTSSETSEDGKSIVVSFKDISVEVDVDFDVTSTEEESYLVASPEAQAAASGSNYGVTTSFGLVTNKEIFYTEVDEETGKASMSGIETHTAEYLALLNKKEQKRAAQLAKSKEFYNLNTVAQLKKGKVDVEGMDPELLALIAEQVLDLESAPNAPLHNDGQDLVKVQVQRYNPETGRWYNAKNRDGSLMVEFYSAEDLFEYDENGFVIGMRTEAHGQTTIANSLEFCHNLTAVHNYQYIDKDTKELVFKSIDQRFILSGKSVNSNVSIEGTALEATLAPSNWTVTKDGEIVEEFQFFGYDNLVDIGEGFFLMPSVDERYAADMEEREYQDGIVTGKSVATVGMSVNAQAKEHIKSQKKEEAELKKVAAKARRVAQTQKDNKNSKRDVIKASGLYQWALEHVELTHDARKSAKLQNELNAKFVEMKDEANDLLEVLAVLKDETGKGFAYPSWQVINSLAKKPKKDSNDAFLAKVKEDIRTNIEAINDGSLDVKGMDVELLEEIIKVCRESMKAGVNLKLNKTAYGKVMGAIEAGKGLARTNSKGPKNGSVKELDVADYYMSRKA